MRKKIATIVLIAGLGFAGVQQASAGWGNSNRAGANYGNCPQLQMNQNTQLDQEAIDKLAKFHQDNIELKRSMVVKNAELRALMRSENPDATKVANLTGEVFDLRVSLQEKAKEAGVDQYMRMGQRGGMGGKGGKRGGMHGQMQGQMQGGWFS